MLGITREVGTNSLATFSIGLLYMDISMLTKQQKKIIHQLCGHWMPSRVLTKSDDS